MQSVIHVTCYGGRGLHEAIINDKRLSNCNLMVLKQKMSGRDKLYSNELKVWGAINL